MKKIVGILGMAAVLGSMAFAAEPAANYVMSEFTGSAEFGVKGDFTKDDALFGMYNEASAGIKFGFMTAGDKTTTGDGVWGELKIKADANDPAPSIPSPIAKAVAVDTAKIHFVDGDFSMAMNLLKPSLKFGGFAPASATPVVASYKTPAAKDTYEAIRNQLVDNLKDKYKKELGDDKTPGTLKYELKVAKEAYETAVAKGEQTYKLYDDYVKAEAAVKDWEATVAKVPGAPAKGDQNLTTSGIGDDTGLANGFGIELKMDKLFAFNVKFMDKGYKVAAKDQKYGLAFDASLLAVENLEAGVALTMNFGTKYTGFQAKAAYNLSLDDKMYIKPAVTYEMVKIGDGKASNALAAGLLFGWGAKDVKAPMDYFQDPVKNDKVFNEGVSVALCPVLGDETQMLMTIGLYDQSLFSLLGLEDFGKLQTAFGFDMVSRSKKADNVNTIRAALTYDVTFSPVYFGTHFGMQAVMAGEDAKFEPSIKFGVKLGSKEVIDNTDLYVSYEMETSTKKDSKPTTNELVIGSKISF